MMFGVVCTLILFAMIDLPRLIREKKRWDLTVYLVCFAAISAYLILFALDVKFVSSIEALHTFFQDRLGLSYQKFR